MMRLTGVLGVVSGFAALASAFPGSPPDAHRHLAEVTQISAPNTRPADAQRFAVPALGNNDTQAGLTQTFGAAPSVYGAGNLSGAAISRPRPHSQIVLTSVQPGDADAYNALVRAIQDELNRLGCYSGETNGVWSKSTEIGMERLVNTANARLPTNAPDYILLALAKASPDGSCRGTRTVMAGLTAGKASAKPGVTNSQSIQERETAAAAKSAPASRRSVTVTPRDTATASTAKQASAEPAKTDAAPRRSTGRRPALRLDAPDTNNARQERIRAARIAAARRAERRKANAELASRRRVASSRNRRLQPTYRLRARQQQRTRSRRSRRFNAQTFFASMNQR